MSKSERCYALAASFLAALPFVMALANRSAPLMLGLAACFAALGAVLDGHWRDALERLREAAITRIGLLALALLGWAALSLLWSQNPAASLFAFGEMMLALAFGIVLALTLPQRAPVWFFKALTLGCVASAALTVIDLQTNLALRKMLDLRPYAFIYNRSVLTLLLVSLPLMAWAWRRKSLFYGLVAALALLLASSWSDSGAAKLGLLAAFAAGMLALFSRRMAAMALGLSLSAALLTAPWLGLAFDRLMPSELHERLASEHSRERVEIWLSFGEAVRLNPFLGNGFGSSARIAETKLAALVGEERRTFLAAGHPHNAAMQIWAELGLVGVCLAALLMSAYLRLALRLDAMQGSLQLALFAAAAAIMMVGHGAWQGWWIASLAAAIVLVKEQSHE